MSRFEFTSGRPVARFFRGSAVLFSVALLALAAGCSSSTGAPSTTDGPKAATPGVPTAAAPNQGRPRISRTSSARTLPNGGAASSVSSFAPPVNTCSPTPNFTLNGGGPETAPLQIVPVIWGSADPETANEVQQFLEVMGTSSYLAGMAFEYGTVSQFAAEPPVAITPFNTNQNITDPEIQAELVQQIASGWLQAYQKQNAMFLLHFPSSMTENLQGLISCQAFCAYHNVTGTGVLYAVVPQYTGTDCGKYCGEADSSAAAVFNAMTAVESHEILETLTDPNSPTGWQDLTDPFPSCNEIGDVCNQEDVAITDAFGTRTVQLYWSNIQNACTSSFPVPSISSVSPLYGPIGTQVVIAGSNLNTGTMHVTFGGVPAASLSCSSSQCTATTPTGTGVQPIAVTDTILEGTRAVPIPSGQGSFTYNSVLSVSPSAGYVGDPVTVAGYNLWPGHTSIRFGTSPAVTPTCSAGNYGEYYCDVTVPPAPPGSPTVDVIATVDGHDTLATPADHFTYAGPAVTWLSRKQGPISGGTVIDVEGTGFDTCPASSGTPASMTVTFQYTDPVTKMVTSVPAASVDCRSASEFYVTSPVVSFTGPWDLIATAYGQASAANPNDVFTYTAAAALYNLVVDWSDGTAYGAVYLDGNAPAPISVTLTSSDSTQLAVPSTVTIPAGSLSVDFTATGANPNGVTLTATYNGIIISIQVPPPPPPPCTPLVCRRGYAWDASQCACIYYGNCAKTHSCY
jgi:hypothetical protein